VLGFAAGAVMFVPVNALIAGVTLSFPALKGFALAMAGGLLGSIVTYGMGLVFGSSIVELSRGPRVDKVVDKLRKNPFRTSLVLHLLPIGNFTAVNLLAGALRVPFFGFLLGTALGLLPGVVFFAFLSDRLPKLLEDPKPLNIALLVLGLAVAVALGLLIRRWAKGAGRHAAA
jgi:phospholipase D1/2